LRSGPSAGAVGRAQNPHFSPTRFHEDPIKLAIVKPGRGERQSDCPIARKCVDDEAPLVARPQCDAGGAR